MQRHAEFQALRNASRPLDEVVRRNGRADLRRGLGYVRTQRGAGGGFRLARPAASITLGQVVRDLERDQPTVECFRADGGDCVLTPRCRLRKHLAEAREAFLEALDGTTLAECAWPAAPRVRKA